MYFEKRSRALKRIFNSFPYVTMRVRVGFVNENVFFSPSSSSSHLIYGQKMWHPATYLRPSVHTKNIIFQKRERTWHCMKLFFFFLDIKTLFGRHRKKCISDHHFFKATSAVNRFLLTDYSSFFLAKPN